MICEACKKRQVEKILAESKKAMKRYTKKLREEIKNEKNSNDLSNNKLEK